MRKVFIILLILCCFFACAENKSRPKDFKGLKWGTNVKDFKDLKILEKPDGFKNYQKKGLKVYNIKVESIGYTFLNDLFAGVSVEFTGGENFLKLKKKYYKFLW